jgi:hypothetical protein
VNPFLRISASLALTLLVWGPSVLRQIAEHHTDLASSSVSFLIVFFFARAAVSVMERLVRSYEDESNQKSPDRAVSEFVERSDVESFSSDAELLRRGEQLPMT